MDRRIYLNSIFRLHLLSNGLKKLKKAIMTFTAVTDDGVAKLKAALPKLEIER